MAKDPSGLEAQIAEEKAAALGRSGRRLRAALDRLARFESGTARGRSAHAGDRARAELVAQAGEAYWSYIVQREALGLIHNESVVDEYGIPPEVARAMRPQLRGA